MPKQRMRQAIRAALDDALAEDSSVILMGEDIAVAGGAFKCTEGLVDRYGSTRVIDTPISEMGFLGAAVGAATRGLRPVVEMMYVEFLGVALDQLTTEAATMRYLSRGTFTVPLVVRASAGGGQGFGCQHSQMLDHWFRGVPGLKVCVASGARTAYGLLRSAIDDPDPVVFLEPRILYGERDDFDVDSKYRVPLGRAETPRRGSDITLVTVGAQVRVALAAAEQCNADVEVIDLCTLSPWDVETVSESVVRTGRLVTLEEATAGAGWGGDVVARTVANSFAHLNAAPHRITLPDAPVPFSGVLEDAYFPQPPQIAAQIEQLVATGSTPRAWWAVAS